MKIEDFEIEFNRLAKEFPKHFGSAQRKELICERVIMLPHHWFKKFIDRMIIQNNPSLDIEEAARGERLSRAEQNLKSDTNAALMVVRDKITDEAFQKILSGSNSLWEAVKNRKGGT